MSSALSSTSSNTADQLTLASCWAPTTDSSASSAVSRSDGVGLRLAQLGDPDVVARCLERVAGPAHELPRLVLAEDDLAPSAGARPEEGRKEAFEAGELILEVLAARSARVHDRGLDGFEVALGTGCLDGEIPVVGVTRRIEEDRELDRLWPDDRATPAIEAAGDLGAVTAGSIEDRAVEVGQHHLGDVGLGPWLLGGCGCLEPRGGGTAHGIDEVGQHGHGEGLGVPAILEDGDRGREALGECGEFGIADQGRRPSHHVGRQLLLALFVGESALELLDGGDHAALGGEPDGERRNGAHPAHAGSGRLVGHRTQRRQPAESVDDPGLDGVGATAVGHLDRSALFPAELAATDAFESGGDGFGPFVAGVVARRPGDELARGPGELELGRPVLDLGCSGSAGRLGRPRSPGELGVVDLVEFVEVDLDAEAGEHHGDAGPLIFEVGQHLPAVGAAVVATEIEERVVDIVEDALQGAAPSAPRGRATSTRRGRRRSRRGGPGRVVRTRPRCSTPSWRCW